ncbi:MAG TPA: hypothetical protein VIK31_03140 [Propionibacteriaceae bacterium]
MTARDYLAEAMETLEHAELDTPTYLTTAALLSVATDVRRIADQMEQPDPNATLRAYLAREGVGK